MRNASLDRTTRYSANAPSISEPSVTGISLLPIVTGSCIVRTSTRSPSRAGSTADPAATMRPQQSAPWMRGKDRGCPDHEVWAAARSCEYQPVRVLMSVLFTDDAPTRIRTSSACAWGTGMS